LQALMVPPWASQISRQRYRPRPVPREPFSFGGFYDSKFGSGDITGASGVEFWSDRKKITVKWSAASDKNWMN
jgi:malonate-semialdehyde dehydrogenase (acetylating)/methylmalonate-semialdehyde dehydrogenase